MRAYRAQVGDRTHEVSIETIDKNRFRAKLGNDIFELERSRADETLLWIIRSNAQTVRAETRVLDGDRIDVYVAGMPFSISLLEVGPEQYVPVANKGNTGEIRALMPGRITNFLVKEGDAVQAGSPLLILEAMKMQNEIVSPISGKVKSIRFKEGDSVGKDSILVVVE